MKYRSSPESIVGSIAPLVTPFTATGQVDTDSLRALVRWQLGQRQPRHLHRWVDR